MITPESFRQRDDTSFIRLQKFFDALGYGVHGELDSDYIVSSQLSISLKSNFTFHGNGHRIKLEDGAKTGWGGSALYIVQCTDFQIVDLICDGNRDNRVTAEDPAHVIIIDKCHRWKFHNVHAINGTCDGFYISAGTDGNGSGSDGSITMSDCPSEWILEQCTALNNYRQGASIIESCRAQINGGRYGLTHGLWESGHGPCAGIDLEPDDKPARPSDRIRDIQLCNILFDGNQGAGLAITRVNGVRNIEVTNCVFDGNKKAAIESVADNVHIIRPKIRKWNQEPYVRRSDAPPKRGAIDIGYLAGPTSIIDPSFENISNGASENNPCIYVHGGAAPDIVISGIRSDGSASFICGAHAPRIAVNCSVVDLHTADRPYAFVFLGDYAVFEDMTLLGVYQCAAYFSGKRPRISNNRFYVRAADPIVPIISTWDSDAPELNRNVVEFAISASSYAFAIGKDASVLGNKVISSTSAHAFKFAGPPRVSSGNSRALPRRGKSN